VEYECSDYNTLVTISDDILTKDIAIGELYYLYLNMNANSSDVKYIKNDIESISEIFMKNKGVVYKLTRTDGLQYIGISCQFDKRYHAHKKSKRFEQGILDVEILFEGTYAECEELESEYIKKYDTFNSGLNSTPHCKGCNPDVENSPWMTLGKKHTNETKEKMKANHWSKTGKYDPTGRKFSEESKQKMSDTRKGKLLYETKFNADAKRNLRLEYDALIITKEDVISRCANKYKHLVTDENLYSGIALRSGKAISEQDMKISKLAEAYTGRLTRAHIKNIILGKTLD
jgi:predicted GIY-YIG superfamily endonuclease